MGYHWLFDYLKAGPARTGAGRRRRVAPRKRPAPYKLNLEPLEDRSLPSSSPPVNFAAGLDRPPAVASFHDPVCLTGSWKPAASMAEHRAFYSATPLDNDRVLVAGGFVRTNGVGPPAGGAYSAGAEIYDPHSNTWSPTGRLLTGRAGHAAVRLEDGRVLVAGGQMVVAPGTPPVTLASAEIYDPATGAWTATGSMHVRRTEPILTLLPDGRVFISGATRAVGPDAKSAEIYDPATGQWTRVADMSTARNDHIQVLLDDQGDSEGEEGDGNSQGEGRILVAGGFRDTIPAPGQYFASAEIYDVRTNTWTPTGSMTMPRADAEGMRLEDGRVMATGGNTAISRPATRTNTAEIYDPETGQWRLTGGAMSEPKVDHAIALLEDGRVLVAGGIRTNDTYTASADLYDARTDTWTPLPSMSRARGGIFAVTLEDGRALVVGGLNDDPGTLPTNALASAELFVPCHHGHGQHGDGEHGDGQHGNGDHGDGQHATGGFRSLVFPGTSFALAVGISPAGDIVGDNPDARGTTQGLLPTEGIHTAAIMINPGVKVVDENASGTRHSYVPSRGVLKSALINDIMDLDAGLDGTTDGSAKKDVN